MEYKMHKCESAICQCFEISTVMERFKLMTYYEKFNSMKEAYVFSFRFLRDCSSGARTNRRSSKVMDKALPNTRDVKLWGQGLPTSWFTDPPRLPKKITKTRARKPEDLANNEILTNNSGLGGLTDAPPSAETREHVYEPIQRENQTESIAV